MGMKIYFKGVAVGVDRERDQLFKDITYGDKTPLTLAATF